LDISFIIHYYWCHKSEEWNKALDYTVFPHSSTKWPPLLASTVQKKLVYPLQWDRTHVFNSNPKTDHYICNMMLWVK